MNYLYQIDNKLIVSKTKRPSREDFGIYEIEFYKALSEWQKNLIPVKEGEEEKFALYCFSKANVFDLRNSFDEAFKNGIEISDEVVRIDREGRYVYFAYLNNQPKKEEMVFGNEFSQPKISHNLQPKKEESNEAIKFESQVDLAKEIQGMFEHNKDWIDVLELFEIKRK